MKDHNYELPIKSVAFNKSENLVLSMDKNILKIWDNDTVRKKVSHRVLFCLEIIFVRFHRLNLSLQLNLEHN